MHPFRSRGWSAKRAPRKSLSPSFRDWIIVPIAPSKTRIRSRNRRFSVSNVVGIPSRAPTKRVSNLIPLLPVHQLYGSPGPFYFPSAGSMSSSKLRRMFLAPVLASISRGLTRTLPRALLRSTRRRGAGTTAGAAPRRRPRRSGGDSASPCRTEGTSPYGLAQHRWSPRSGAADGNVEPEIRNHEAQRVLSPSVRAGGGIEAGDLQVLQLKRQAPSAREVDVHVVGGHRRTGGRSAIPHRA